jgi:two-component system chemotaxis response regulator CheB
MLSAAKAFGHDVVGVILTGMGSDGLEGMTAIHEAGGITIGQDESTCIVYGVARCCAERGVLQTIAPLPQIPVQIMKAINCEDLRTTEPAKVHSSASATSASG